MPKRQAIESDIDAQELNYSSHDGYVLRAIDAILGDGRRSHLAGDPRLKPGKLSQLAMDGIRPLSWDDLDPKQQKELDRVLPIRQPDSLVRYGDAIIVVGDTAAWKKRQKRKDIFKRAEESGHTAAIGTRVLSREIGTEVTDR